MTPKNDNSGYWLDASGYTWSNKTPTFTVYAIWNPATVTLPESTREGWTFLGWYTAPDDTDLDQSYGGTGTRVGGKKAYLIHRTVTVDKPEATRTR